MKILFITDNFPPEVNAPATRTFEHCRQWVKAGQEVTVITCFPNFPQGKVYPGYRNRWKRKENIDGIEVIRVWSFISPNKGTLKRLIDFWSFMVTAFISGLTVETDIIISTSPQFFTSLTGSMLSWVKRKPWVMEIRDLWPESLWMMDKRSFSYRLFERLEYAMYKRASLLVVVTESFKETIAGNGIRGDKIHVIYNGINSELFQSRPKSVSLLDRLGLTGKVIFGYIGTIGTAHNVPFYVQCFHELHDELPSIHLLIIGDGAERKNVEDMIARCNPKNVSYLEPVPKKEVPEYTSLVDIGLVPLRNKVEYAKVIPSKIFELAAMHKYCFLGVPGESKRIVEGYQIGSCFEPENSDNFKHHIRQLMDHESFRNIPAENYDRFSREFDRAKMANTMLTILQNAVKK